MSTIIPKYKAGDMFSMEPDSRFVIISICKTTCLYRLAHVIQDRVINSPEMEIWHTDKLHGLVDRGKMKFICNIFSIVTIPCTFIRT